MSSATQQTRIQRKAKLTKAGRKRKKADTKAGTPKFPIHPEGSRAKAAPAKAAAPKAAAPKAAK